jgi:type II secretory pathway component PulF
MPLFAYRIIDTKGKVTQATASASSRDELAQELLHQGSTPLSIKEVHKVKKTGKLPITEKITFCRYISTMLKSGLSLTESIRVLSQEVKHPITKKVLNDLDFGISHGQTLSTVFSHYPETFDHFFVTLVKSGEVSGTLSETFEQIQEEIRAEHSLTQKIQAALLYPTVVFVAMLGIGILMMFFILPQIGEVFLRLRLPLNPAVELMFKTVVAISKVKFWIFAGMAASVIATGLFFRTSLGRRFFLALIMPIPPVRNLVKQIDMARFCRIFSTLLTSGVPITQALEISLNSLSFTQYQKRTKNIVEKISQGQDLSTAFRGSKAFPPLLIQMIAAGEKSGTLDSILKDLAEFYEEEVENGVKKLTQLLEPVLMLLVGVGVGVMILTVITPIYSVVSNLQSAQ